MKLVKEAFVNSLERELLAAISLSCVVDMGKTHFESRAEELKGKFRHGFISVNEPQLGQFANANVAIEEAYEFVKFNPWLVIEIFHGLMIQSWFQFLFGIYVEMIYDTRHGHRTYPIDKVRVPVDPEVLSKEYLPDTIRRSLMDNFDFQKAEEKLRIVAKGLGKKVEHLEPELGIIRQEILVRNLIQHNKGNIRIDDIEQNRGPFSRVDKSAGRIKQFSSGNRIERDLYDLRMLAGVMHRISDKLLPDEELL